MQNGNLRIQPDLIGIDWGTSSFRAYLMTNQGELLDHISHPGGILKVEDGDFAGMLQSVCGGWLDRWPDLPVLMCGMIGSQSGWQEARYLTGMVGVSELASQLTQVDVAGRELHIVPGLAGRDFTGGPDVMRGEETILVGALALGGPQSGYYCLPGTHSKWVNLARGQITGFSTYLTGEMFALLRDQSILSPLMTKDELAWKSHHEAAFLEGIDMAREGAGLLHQLFSLRAAILTQEAGSAELVAKLSGLLIGTELLVLSEAPISAPITLVSAGGIGDRYQTALRHLGFEVSKLDADDCCRRGLADISKMKFVSSAAVAG